MKKIEFDCSNMPGVAMLFAIPKKSFKRIRKNYSLNKNYLELIYPDELIEIYFTEDTAEFKETGEANAYAVSFTGVIPKSNPINQEHINTLDAGLWMILFLDNNGYIRLMGDEENQLKFKYDETTGSGSGKNQLSFTFSGNQTHKTLFIEPEGITFI